MLITLVALLAASVVAVPLSRRAGFGSVLGYLVAGVAIGPGGLGVVHDVGQIAGIAGLGVVMLLFLIGLEVRPQRLWVMRRAVFGLGAAQLLLTGAALALLAHRAGVSWQGAAVLGAGLAMSSTAIVLPMLAERDLLTSRAGRDGFAVLLFQDLAFIPLVAAVPLLASGASLPHSADQLPWLHVARAAAAVIAILIGGRYLVRPMFRAIGGAQTAELFTTLALLIVAGTAALAHAAGLSMSLGAFMAGVLLSNSEYRHELQADIAPFEGLLLGFFFISVGMQANLHFAAAHARELIAAVAVLVAVKAGIAFVLALIARQDRANAVRFALALPQGSEFSFILFATASALGLLDGGRAALATLAIAASMMVTPILFAVAERLLIPHLEREEEAPVFEPIAAPPAPVIICGFGRVGQIVGRVLTMHGIPFTALERDPGQVEVVRRFGAKVYFGDPARADVLRAAGAEQATLLVVALDDTETTLKVVEVARHAFPALRLLVRARNRRHAHRLMDRGVTDPVRDTFHSALFMARQVLGALDVPEEDAARSVALFRAHDEKQLRAAHAIYRDEKKMIQSVKEAAEELTQLFEDDQTGRAEEQERRKRGRGKSGADPAAPEPPRPAGEKPV
ncbi:MAG: monovalent cation:proton antiporter-2 (CPA2) family protein [Rhodospirillales bacterium]|nr:monovalent cation:proton antiporter-2 (CPA2) family protein [Rhodospirillales bacterium]